MKQFIRYNTFETNSSSMHSLVVVKDPKPYKSNELLSDCVYKNKFQLFNYIDEGTYERYPFQVLRTPRDKLKYYVAYYLGACKRLELIPEILNFIHEETGVPKENILLTIDDDDTDELDSSNTASEPNFGYASINDTGEDVFSYIEKNNISLKEFVTNPKYVVIVDGDEYQEFKKLFESNILDANDFEYISSGPEFWNDSVYEISLWWLQDNDCDYSLMVEGLSSVNKFVKEVRFNIWDECIDRYNNYFSEIKMFIQQVRDKFPSIEISICCNKKLYDKVKALDLSIFDYLKIRKEDYSDEIIENIKIY